MSSRRAWSEDLADMLQATSEESVRAASVDWVRRSLAAEGVYYDDQHADELVSTAERFYVAIELLIAWIHDEDRRSWELASFERWCRKYARARAMLAKEELNAG